jgi:hypothetical protein
VQPFVLEVAHAPGDGKRTLSFLAAVALAVAGMALALLRGSLLPLVATVVALAWLVWLFRTQPLVQHAEYLLLDNHGLKYMHTPGSNGRVSQYAWSEIQSVSVKLASKGEDFQGLSVLTTRSSLGGLPVLLAVFSEQDCIAACKAVEQQLEERRVGASHDA